MYFGYDLISYVPTTRRTKGGREGGKGREREGKGERGQGEKGRKGRGTARERRFTLRKKKGKTTN